MIVLFIFTDISNIIEHGWNIKVRLNQGETKIMKIRGRGKQECSLSMILFN